MPGQVCILEEVVVVVKVLPRSIKAVVCLLIKVKGDPHMVMHSIHSRSHLNLRVHASVEFEFIVKFIFIVWEM